MPQPTQPPIKNLLIMNRTITMKTTPIPGIIPTTNREDHNLKHATTCYRPPFPAISFEMCFEGTAFFNPAVMVISESSFRISTRHGSVRL